jgi:hypothetical protein
MNASIMLHTITEVRCQDFIHADFLSTRYNFQATNGSVFEVTVFGEHGAMQSVPLNVLPAKDCRETAA